VFEKTPGARVGGRASVLTTDSGLRTNSELAQIVLAVLGLGAVILIFAWLMLSESHWPEISGLGPGPDCAGLGRGDVHLRQISHERWPIKREL
jgi:hypothetical protein